MRIAVRGTERCLAHAHTRRLEQLTNRKTALPIAVADQDAESVEHALVRERRPGRPSALPEIRRLLVRMAIENPRWGWAHARADSSICAAPYVSRFGRFRSADAQSGASPSPSNLGLQSWRAASERAHRASTRRYRQQDHHQDERDGLRGDGARRGTWSTAAPIGLAIDASPIAPLRMPILGTADLDARQESGRLRCQDSGAEQDVLRHPGARRAGRPDRTARGRRAPSTNGGQPMKWCEMCRSLRDHQRCAQALRLDENG